jgi:hypothetical protein
MTMAQEIQPGTVTFPPYAWIPNPDQITDSAACILAVVGGALDGMGVGADFTRRVFTHGTAPLNLTDMKHSQLLVNLKNLELGRAGAKQFQAAEGNLGRYAMIVAEFDIQLWTPWATPKGGLNAKMADDDVLMQHTFDLNKVCLVAYAALRAYSLGGVKADPPMCPIIQDNILVGPATPLGPDGSFAGWSIPLELQY